MCYLNSVQLIGNLGSNPEEVKTNKDKDAKKGTFVKISLAINKKYTNAKGELVPDTQWHTVYLNNKIADFALTYLKKGSKALIIGELRNHQWKDKDGVIHRSTAVHARECRAFFNKDKSDTKAADKAAIEAAEAVACGDDYDTYHDDIPF